eukprot:scaffold877_cov198-Ochromonas_danica.AAC.3
MSANIAKKSSKNKKQKIPKKLPVLNEEAANNYEVDDIIPHITEVEEPLKNYKENQNGDITIFQGAGL